MFSKLNFRLCAVMLLGSAIQAFGAYNIHSISNVTEGGVLGLVLLLHHWLGVSPAISGLVLNGLCYLLGWRVLGKGFLGASVISCGGFSLFYAIFEQFPPVWPGIAELPLLAAVLGALFIGVGAGICVRVGSATGGDDALAMSINKLTGVNVQWVYLVSDLAVLGLSASYIPLRRLVYSLLTVVLSGQLIGLVQRLGRPKAREPKAAPTPAATGGSRTGR